MNRNEKVYYVYVENGKAVITEEKPDFNKIKNYTMVKANGKRSNLLRFPSCLLNDLNCP